MIAPETLRCFPFCVGLGEAELKSMSIIADEVEFQRGAFIFTEDATAHTLYLLLDGWVDIVINSAARGKRRELVTTLTPGEIFGWSAVVEPYIYTASAVCASPVKAIGLKGTDLLALFEIDRRLCSVIMRRICRVIASRLHATRRQMVSLFVTH